MNRLVCPGAPQLRGTVGCQKNERNIRMEGFDTGRKQICHSRPAGGHANGRASGCHRPSQSGKGHAAFVVVRGHIVPAQGSGQWGAARSRAEKKSIRAKLAKPIHEHLPPGAIGRNTAHAESTFKTPEILSSSSNHSRSGSEPSTIPAPAKTSTREPLASIERIATANSAESFETHPNGPAYQPLSNFSCLEIKRSASATGAPHVAGVG